MISFTHTFKVRLLVMAMTVPLAACTTSMTSNIDSSASIDIPPKASDSWLVYTPLPKAIENTESAPPVIRSNKSVMDTISSVKSKILAEHSAEKKLEARPLLAIEKKEPVPPVTLPQPAKVVAAIKDQVVEKAATPIIAKPVPKPVSKSEFVEFTPPVVLDKPETVTRTLSDYKNRTTATELARSYFTNQGYDFLELNAGITTPVFLSNAPKNLSDVFSLLQVSPQELVIDKKTKTAVLKRRNSKQSSIGDVFVNSNYGDPLQARFAIKHDANKNADVDISTGTHHLDDAHIKSIPTSYGTLIEIYGETPVNTTFSLLASFSLLANNGQGQSIAAMRDLYIQPKNIHYGVNYETN